MKSDEVISIRGAREHNLKGVSVEIPVGKLTVITGPSGSGKSSLAFDTLFAEGQRRYLESLSAYARQFMEQMSKPDVDEIDGLSPAISIEQKTSTFHPRSTVGTVTSIYDFLRLLFARVGEVRDPSTGEALKAHTDDDIFEFIRSFPANEKITLLAAAVRGKKGEFLRELEQWRKAGFTKAYIDGTLRDLQDPILLSKYQNHEIDVVLDSVTPSKAELETRIKEAFTLCDKISGGWLKVAVISKKQEKLFNKKIAAAGTEFSFPELEPRLFSFNSPYGMCEKCRGSGVIGSAKTKNKSDDEDDEEFWSLPDIDESEICPACQGRRLRPEALSVFYNGRNISELSDMSCISLLDEMLAEKTTQDKNPVSRKIRIEISSRLKFLVDVGVGYLTISRAVATLSGGEAQRIRLATQLGSDLSGVLYVLDEPSIGLHPADHKKLLGSLHKLKALGNTITVVEHDEETIREADFVIDMGPGAGVRGGRVVAEGTPKEIEASSLSLTGAYLRGEKNVVERRARRPGNGKFIELKNCTGHNLQGVNLSIPLGKLVVVTGVSGSGKSSLIQETLEVALAQKLYRNTRKPLPFDELKGIEHVDKMVHVDQRPIGRTPRSNPATYTGLFTALRQTFAKAPEAQIRGYGQGTFSFNVKGGRCDSCEGAGRVKIEMHFLPDVYVLCEKCMGRRYRREVLEVRFRDKNISDVLGMPIEDAHELFRNHPLLEPKLKTLTDVGLGYITLGQPATTLSGGEAQRIKLSKELSKKSTGKTIYFLDEPTTGLHFDDVRKLLELLQRLCDTGNTVVVIEHNLDVIGAADWVIDVGPGSGINGGHIVREGVPEDFAKDPQSQPTATYIADYFKQRKWDKAPATRSIESKNPPADIVDGGK